MTVSSTSSRNDYSAGGASCAFSYTFPITTDSALAVYVCNVLVTNYSVSGAGSATGGTVTFSTVPAAGSAVAILRNEAYTQGLDLVEHGPASADTLETELDHEVMLDQQLLEITDRALKFPAFSCDRDIRVNTVVGQAGKVASVSTNENAVEWVSVSSAQAAATGSFTASGTGASARTVSSKLGDMVSVKDYGAVGNGTTDDTTAFQNALNSGAGTIFVPVGVYKITATLTVAAGCRVVGLGAGPGANTTTGDNTHFGSVIEHNFDGTLFNVTGVNGSVIAGVGAGFENLLLRQTAGTGTTQKGTAIQIIGASDTFSPSWVRIRHVTMEVGTGKDDWNYGIYMDGSGKTSTAAGGGLRDIWIESVRVNCGANGTAAMYGTNVGNLFISECELNGTNGHLTITAPAAKLSASVSIVQTLGVTCAIDRAQNVFMTAGAWTTITTTSASTILALHPNFITNTPSTPAGTSIVIAAYVSALSKYAFITPSSESIRYQTNGVGFVNGTNAFVGTLDGQQFSFVSNAATRMTISPCGQTKIVDGGFHVFPRPMSTLPAGGVTCDGYLTVDQSLHGACGRLFFYTCSGRFYINGTSF